MAVVGVDGCTAGWFAVVLREDREPEGRVLTHIGEIAAAVPDAELVAIDIPIGHTGAGRPRAADVEARRFLGARRNSVFPAPHPEVLLAPDYAQASAASLRVAGKGISKQSFALRAKIVQVRDWLARTPLPVFEVHPEVSFALLLGAPAGSYKKTGPGMVERREALIGAGIEVDHLVADAGLRVGFDDVMDAAAAAWSGRRLAAGTARSFPADPPPDPADGRPVAIWA